MAAFIMYMNRVETDRTVRLIIPGTINNDRLYYVHEQGGDGQGRQADHAGNNQQWPPLLCTCIGMRWKGLPLLQTCKYILDVITLVLAVLVKHRVS